MSSNQAIAIVSSPDDGIYYKFNAKEFIDLDIKFKIGSINTIVYDNEEQHFYMLANKFNEKLGFYLIQFEEENPSNHKFFMKYHNKLDIGNADIAIIRNKRRGFKELLISYKTIFMNTYTL